MNVNLIAKGGSSSQCLVAEISREALTQTLGEDLYTIVQRNSLVKILKGVHPLASGG
jgi:hypothetical protein